MNKKQWQKGDHCIITEYDLRKLKDMKMHLITLNIWGGFVREPLLNFIKFHQKIDIFCLQEVYHNALHQMSDDGRAVSLDIFERIQELLPNHIGYFRPVLWNSYGIAIFIKNNISTEMTPQNWTGLTQS